MERRLGPIEPSRSAHGQASLGSEKCPQKKKICPVFVTHCESYVHDIKNCCFGD